MKSVPRWQRNFAAFFALLVILGMPQAKADNSRPASPPAPTLTKVDRNALAKKATEDRLAYAASAEYSPYETETRNFKKTAREFMEKNKYAKAIIQAKKGLAVSKYDIDLMIILVAAYRASGDTANADRVDQQWMSLMDSILSTGDGRSFESAFRVINIAEEYAVLRILGLEVTSQSLAAHGSSEFDLMQVRDPKSGKEFSFYFNIDQPKRWLTAQFSKPSK